MSERGFDRPGKFPYFPTFATVVMAVAIYLANRYLPWLNERYNLDPGIIRINSTLGVVVVILVWLVWILGFSRLRWSRRLLYSGLIVLGIATFLTLFKRVSDGDVGLVRFEPRFWARQADLPDVDATNEQATARLAPTTPNDFPQFLGPARNGVIDHIFLEPDWSAHPPKLHWRHDVGEGWSGFVAVNGFAVTQEQRGQDECVVCYEIDSGKPVWIHKSPTRHEDVMAMGRVGPRATPTIHDGKVYAQGGTGWLWCLDGRDGSEIWSLNLPDLLGIEMETRTNSLGHTYQYEKSPLAWGRASSPIVHNNQLLVCGGGPAGGPFVTLLALDPNTGHELWRGGDAMISYATPTPARLLDTDQVLVVAQDAMLSIDPQSGQTLWQVDWPGKTDANATCTNPTVIDDQTVLLSKAYGIGAKLIRVKRTGSQWNAETVWEDPRLLKTKFSNPVFKDGHVYALSDGFLECVEVANKHRKWKKRRRFGNGQLLLVGNHLLVHSEFGQLFLVEANPEAYVELGHTDTIEGVCWNTLCLYGNRLLVRSELEAACLELAIQDSAVESPADDGQVIAEDETKD